MTHGQRILSKLSSALVKRPGSNNAALAETIGGEFDDIEAVMQDISQAHAIDTATGASLDRIAALFGVPRAGGSDIDLRAAVRIEFSRRQSNGTLADIVKVITGITGVPASEITVIERPAGSPAASFYFLLEAANSRPFKASTLVEGVLRAKAAGVAYLSDQLILIWTCPEVAADGEVATSVQDLVAQPWGWGLHPWGTEPWGGYYVVARGEPAEVQVIPA